MALFPSLKRVFTGREEPPPIHGGLVCQLLSFVHLISLGSILMRQRSFLGRKNREAMRQVFLIVVDRTDEEYSERRVWENRKRPGNCIYPRFARCGILLGCALEIFSAILGRMRPDWRYRAGVG